MKKWEKSFEVNGERVFYFSIEEMAKYFGKEIGEVPYSIRALLENTAYHHETNGFEEEHIQAIILRNENKGTIPFLPTRVVMQDFTGVPCVVDLASMRNAVMNHGGDVTRVNPKIPVDLVIDHSVQVDCSGKSNALVINSEKEFQRNKERYEFLKWAGSNFEHFRIVPPETGIIHQVNLEYLSKALEHKEIDGITYVTNETIFGTDSHTTMINALGVLGWGVGGVEAEAALLGIPSFIQIPEVVGVKLSGKLSSHVTATDLALKVTERLRKENVVGKFVEYFGDGYTTLTLEDRATLANMAPEYGATCGYCPIDEKTISYLEMTGRTSEEVARFTIHSKENCLFYDVLENPHYDKVVEIDLGNIAPSVSGPKRPQDRIELKDLKESFERTILIPTSESGYEREQKELEKFITCTIDGEEFSIQTGDVLIAAITSCTNTSNPYLLLQAGLLAKKAVELGLGIKKTVKTSFAPGSKVATAYLQQAGLLPYMEKLGFGVVGYGCTTCIGNSGPLLPEIEEAIKGENLITASVLSGNRNFEGRIHPLIQANFLASPALVIAYAIAGTMRVDITKEALGIKENGENIFLNDILPSREEVITLISSFVTQKLFEENYEDIYGQNNKWNEIQVPQTSTYTWNSLSTYIQNPPYFNGLLEEKKDSSLKGMRVLAKLGDSVTTDHISPAGSIPIKSPAGEYLSVKGVEPKDFNSYGSRRGNHEVMVRGTLANVRVKNRLLPNTEGGVTMYFPTEDEMSIYDASEKYKEENVSLLILAGSDYGMGSSRDWAAKGVQLLGVRVVIAKSFERIHRSNLVMMGVLPMEFEHGEDAEVLGLTGEETYSIELPIEIEHQQKVKVIAEQIDGVKKEFYVTVRIDSEVEKEYVQNKGILPMVAKKFLGNTLKKGDVE